MRKSICHFHLRALSELHDLTCSYFSIASSEYGQPQCRSGNSYLEILFQCNFLQHATSFYPIARIKPRRLPFFRDFHGVRHILATQCHSAGVCLKPVYARCLGAVCEEPDAGTRMESAGDVRGYGPGYLGDEWELGGYGRGAE